MDRGNFRAPTLPLSDSLSLFVQELELLLLSKPAAVVDRDEEDDGDAAEEEADRVALVAVTQLLVVDMI